MTRMLWFGGFSGRGAAPRVPAGARELWPAVPGSWLCGDWPAHEVRTACTGRRALAFLGPCGIRGGELAQLAVHGVPDGVVWRWPGSYVVVQATEDGTTVWTDVGGAWPVYTLSADGGVYWASSSRALAALTGRLLDSEWLAASLLAPAVPVLLEGRSAFARVSHVPAGHRLVLPKTGRPDSRPLWHPRPRPGNHAALLRAELSAAVSIRVDAASAPTADLSGGYDSTAIALLAAERLSPDKTVVAVTVHPDGVTTGGDLRYARQAGQHSGIAHRFMPLGPEHAPYGALDAVPVTDEPAPSTIAHTRFSAQLCWMRDRFGSDCHMTGDGGDGLLSSRPIMLADLMARLRFRRALAEAIAWARLRRIAVWPLLVAAVGTANTCQATALRALARSLRSPRPRQATPSDGGVGWCPAFTVPSWSTPHTRHLAASLAADAADRAASIPPGAFGTHVTAAAMAHVGRTARADAQIAECHGIALHNPFADSRVIDTYLSVPLDVRPGPAEFKPLLARAMDGLFPPELARRSTKGTFTSDYYGGLRANLAALHELADGLLAAAGLIDPGRFQQTLTLAAAGVPAAFTTVEPVIAAEVWLRALDAAPPVHWTTAREGA